MSRRSPQSPRRQDPARRPMPVPALVLAMLMAAGAAQAQTATGAQAAQGTVGAATADPKAPLSDVDRAKRDADKVFQWIKFHAEKGEARKAAEKQHEARTEPPKAVAKPATAPAAPAVTAKRQDLDPVAERALAERAQAERGTASPAPLVTPPPATQTAAAPSGGAPSPAVAQATEPPQVVAMAAPATTAPAGKPPAAMPAPTPKVAEPEEDAPLKLIRKVDPEYPRNWLQQQRNGSVEVRFTVRPDGSIESAEALRAPDRKVAAAVVNAVKQWRFEPVNRPRQVSVEIGFQVD